MSTKNNAQPKKSNAPDGLAAAIDSEIERIKKVSTDYVEQREVARQKVIRLRQMIDDLVKSGQDLEHQVGETGKAIADIIADAGDAAELAKLRKSSVQLKAEIEGNADLISQLKRVALPAAEAELKKRTDLMSRVLGGTFDLSRNRLEKIAEKAFNEVMGAFKKWDADSRKALAELNAQAPSIGLVAGSDRLALQVTSEPLVAHFNHFYASMGIDMGLWRKQNLDRQQRYEAMEIVDAADQDEDQEDDLPAAAQA